MLLLTVGVFFASAVSARADSLHLEAGHDIYWLPPRAELFEDTTKAMSLDRVLAKGSFTPLRDRGFGHASSAYWIRFAYASAAPPDAFYLFLGYKPTIVDFYLLARGKVLTHERSGNSVPFAERPLKVQGWVAFVLPTPQRDPATVYLRILTREPQVSLAIDSNAFFWHTNLRNIVVYASLAGILISLIFTALLLFGLMRRAEFLIYGGYLLAQLVYRANDTGAGAAVLWPNLAIPWNAANVALDGLTVCLAALFVRTFLRVETYSKILDRLNIVVAAIAATYAILAIVGVEIPTVVAWRFAFVYVPLWIAIGIVAWIKGNGRAKLFLAAWTAYMAGMIALDLKNLGIGSGNFVLQNLLAHGPYIGLALESLLLSTSLTLELQEVLRAKRRLETLATTDALTGIPNRRAFGDRFDAEWNRALRRGEPIAVLMLDIDMFKTFNDIYGHGGGDECLRTVARAGATCVQRSSDLFARIGGEEFAAILSDTDAQGAIAVAESISRVIAALRYEHRGSTLGHVSVCIGVASITPTSAEGIEALLQTADAALYQAKFSGRNRVATATWMSEAARADRTAAASEIAASGAIFIAGNPT